MPSFETIKEYYLSGKWTLKMLKNAMVCKAITKDQYDEIVAAATEAE